MLMKEQRLDLRIQNKPRHKKILRTAKRLSFFNKVPPFSCLHEIALKKIFGSMGENCYIQPPIYMNIGDNIFIGNRVSINPYFKCMAAGKVTIEDDVKIATGVSVLTNGHDFYERSVLTIKDVLIKKNAWIGAGAIILAGVTIGENAVVGAGSVVTHDVKDGEVVAGNPARVIRTLDLNKFEKI